MQTLKYDTDVILDAFSLERKVQRCHLLDKLLQVSITPLSTIQAQQLERKRHELEVEGEFWNEEELKMNFLAHLFDLVELNEIPRIKIFYERSLSADIDGYKLKVICDMLVATPLGIGTPKQPYFFLQEFKKAKNVADAEAQMLMAMLIAQHQNNNQKPIYGCWLQGKSWNFTVLQDKFYCVSRLYDASQPAELALIVQQLKGLKQVILKELI